MGLKSWLFGNFIEEVEWKNNTKELLFYKFPLEDKEVSYNAKLKVKDGEVAIFALNSEIFDTFTYGVHIINSDSLPNIANALKWDSNYDEPIKVDIYFVNKEEFNFYWSTKKPILLHDKDNSIAKVDASGYFKLHINKLKLFLEYILNNNIDFKTSINDFFYDNLVESLINRTTSIYYLGSNKEEFSQYIYNDLSSKFKEKGLILDSIVTQTISVEQEAASYTGLSDSNKIEDKPIYYIIKNSKPDGPYSKSEILNFINSGKLIAASYIWKEGLKNWVKVKELFNL